MTAATSSRVEPCSPGPDGLTASLLARTSNRLMQTLAPGVYELHFTLTGYLAQTVKTRIDP
jgi:hypothetical protein